MDVRELVADSIMADIYDDLDGHDCHLSDEDGCDCTELDEGVVITTTKTVNIPVFAEDDQSYIH